MARFVPKSPADLKMLSMGMCPDCGASVSAGMQACSVCKLDFGEHASVLKPAAPPPAAPAAPRASAGPAPASASPAAMGKPLSLADIDELERGFVARNILPFSAASVTDTPDNGQPGIGSSLAHHAVVVMADAALADDPMVLVTRTPAHSPLPRALIDVHRSSAADPENFEPWYNVPPTSSPQRAAAAAKPALDPDATLVHDQAAIAAAMAQVQAAQGVIAARGGARKLE